MGPINHEVIPVGLLGALGGTLTGMVCVVVLGQPCHASVFTGMVVAACAIKGYPVLVHTMGQIRAVLLSILSMIKTFLSDQFDLSRRMARLFHERELLWQQNQAYRAEFDRMRQWERQLCALRHDMKNHLSVLRTYAALGQTEKLEQYLDRLGQPLIPPGFVHTGNPEIDSMLNYKLEQAERAGAKLELDVRLPEGFAADVFDLTIILGNLLDNALEGLKKAGPRRFSYVWRWTGVYFSSKSPTAMTASCFGRAATVIPSIAPASRAKGMAWGSLRSAVWWTNIMVRSTSTALVGCSLWRRFSI